MLMRVLSLCANRMTVAWLGMFILIATSSPADAQETGLDFPGSDAVGSSSTMRFKFTDPHLNGLPIYGPNGNGVTYIWRANPRRQAGYYTAFFWGNDDGVGEISTFIWNNGGADTYYGFHPYPDPPPDGTNHKWEVSADARDFRDDFVEYDRWHTQAAIVWQDANDEKHHEYYWDLPNTDANHRVIHVSSSNRNNVNPPSPALTWGDAPWQPGKEVWNGVLRGIQIYSTRLSLDEIQAEINDPLSTTAGAASIWYLNINPTPSDISDKSGRGNNPTWVGNQRPTLYVDGNAPKRPNPPVLD